MRGRAESLCVEEGVASGVVERVEVEGGGAAGGTTDALRFKPILRYAPGHCSLVRVAVSCSRTGIQPVWLDRYIPVIGCSLPLFIEELGLISSQIR